MRKSKKHTTVNSRKMDIVVAAGSFKDVYTPMEATALIKDIVHELLPDTTVHEVPIADGGEYSADLLADFFEYRKVRVKGIVDARGIKGASFYVALDSKTAYIASSAVVRLGAGMEKYKNPLLLTSFGLGQLIKHAVGKGFSKLIIGMGGTSTVDGGIGMAQALGLRFVDSADYPLKPSCGAYFCGRDLNRIAAIRPSPDLSRLGGIRVEVLCDADVTLRQMKIPTNQKIGDLFNSDREKIVINLHRGLHSFGKAVKTYIMDGHAAGDVSDRFPDNEPFLGTAGGIMLSLAALFNIQASLGVDFFYRISGLERLLKNADMVITGEGKLDNSLHGKGPVGISRQAMRYRIPVIYLAGMVPDALKKRFTGYVARSLPKSFTQNGVTAIVSAHPFYDNRRTPDGYDARVRFYRRYNRRVFTEAIADFISNRGEAE